MMSSSEDDCDEGDDGDIVSQLMLKVEEQDSQMRMAAEIGQSLLEKNECLSSDLEESEGERSRLEALLGEITYRNKELEDASPALVSQMLRMFRIFKRRTNACSFSSADSRTR